MEIIATNHGHKARDKWERWDYGYEIFLVVMCFGFAVFLTVAVWKIMTNPILTFDPWWVPVVLGPEVVMFIYAGLFRLDLYLRWRYAVETVWVHDESLIIECRKCIFHRWKKILLSSIRRVESHNDTSGALWFQSNRPEKLRIHYSRRRYRFGLCMTDEARDALAKKIMDLVEHHC